jgi:hypothetical protein
MAVQSLHDPTPARALHGAKCSATLNRFKI